MKVKLIKDIFLTGANIRRAGEIIDVVVGDDSKLYILYKTCCANGKREVTQDEYEIINENDNN